MITDGPRVEWFFKKYLTHVKGEWAGTPLALEQWQRDFIYELYSVNPKTGKRFYTEGILGIPRKNGKSSVASGLGHYMLTMDGENGPEIFSGAGSKDQARITLDPARQMVAKSPQLQTLVKTFRDSIVAKDGNGTWKVVAHSGDLNQGSNPHFAVLDEMHVYKTDELYNAFAAGIGARTNPMILAITTAGNMLGSPLGTLYRTAKKLPEVEQPTPYLTICRDKENGFLMYWYGLDEGSDADIENPELMNGCNPASWVTPEFLKKQLGKPSMRELDFRRFHLNQWCENSGAGIDPKKWDTLKQQGIDIPDGEMICIGVDASYREDPSAVVWGAKIGEKLIIKSKIFNPPEDKTKELDISATVDRTVIELCERYNVRKIRCDKFLIRVLMQEWMRRGWPVEDFPMWDSSMCPASASFLEAVNMEMIAHDGDPELRQHILNMRMKDTNRAWRFDRYDRAMPIDAGIAAIMMVDALRSDEGNVYETRGVFVL